MSVFEGGMITCCPLRLRRNGSSAGSAGSIRRHDDTPSAACAMPFSAGASSIVSKSGRPKASSRVCTWGTPSRPSAPPSRRATSRAEAGAGAASQLSQYVHVERLVAAALTNETKRHDGSATQPSQQSALFRGAARTREYRSEMGRAAR